MASDRTASDKRFTACPQGAMPDDRIVSQPLGRSVGWPSCCPELERSMVGAGELDSDRCEAIDE